MNAYITLFVNLQTWQYTVFVEMGTIKLEKILPIPARELLDELATGTKLICIDDLFPNQEILIPPEMYQLLKNEIFNDSVLQKCARLIENGKDVPDLIDQTHIDMFYQ